MVNMMNKEKSTPSFKKIEKPIMPNSSHKSFLLLISGMMVMALVLAFCLFLNSRQASDFQLEKRVKAASSPELNEDVTCLAHISDVHIEEGVNEDLLRNTLLYFNNVLKPNLIISTGDTATNDAGSNPVANFTDYANLVKSSTIPVYTIPGNHDSQGGIDRFISIIGPTQVSVDINNYRFLGFWDLDERYDPNFAWLEARLKEVPPGRAFFFGHLPIVWPSELTHFLLNMSSSIKTRLSGLTSTYKVMGFSSGHLHEPFIQYSATDNLLDYGAPALRKSGYKLICFDNGVVSGLNLPINQIPIALITRPENYFSSGSRGKVSGTTKVRAKIFSTSAVSSAYYQIDSNPSLALNLVANNVWEATWDTTTASNGQHSVSVRFTTADGKSVSDSIGVYVDQALPPTPTSLPFELTPTPTSPASCNMGILGVIKNPGNGSTVYRSGQVSSWYNYNNIGSSNNTHANTSYNSKKGFSGYLDMKGFAFSIPTNATIEGISVGVEKQGIGNAGFVISDETVQLLKAGVAVGSNKADQLTVWGNTDSWKYYGAADLWGSSWTPANINSSSFGLRFAFQKNAVNGIGKIDTATIQVLYSLPCTQAPNPSVTPTFNPTVTPPTTPSTTPSLFPSTTPTTKPTATPTTKPTATPSPTTFTPTPGSVSTTVTFQQRTNGYLGAKDTFLDPYNLNSNCQSTLLKVGDKQRKPTLLSFDLSSIPVGATVSSAKLQLYGIGWSGANISIEFFNLLRSWNDCQASWIKADSNNWEVAGANGATDRGTTAITTITTSGIQRWYEINLTGLVQSWINNPESNKGLLVRGKDPYNISTYYFASSEDTAARGPKLTVTYK